MLNAVRIWILFSTLLVASGWILSAFHQLNRAGYGLVFVLAATVFVIWQRKTKWHPTKNFQQLLLKFKRRFKRTAPFLFFIVLLLSLISGLLYQPYNSDAFAYRFPRVLHWLGQERWHWIHTADMRMNVAGCGYEWLVTPVVLFTDSFRFVFLLNLIPFLLLPGLVFCLLRELQVAPRVSWWWMWLLPCGWCFVLQSASLENDAFITVYALAAVTLALMFRRSGKMSDLWLSFLAVCLMTGVKQTVFPLVILWIIAIWQHRQLFFKNLAALSFIAVISILVSAIPLIVANWIHTGTCFGINTIEADFPGWHIRLQSPFWGIVGNLFCIPLRNLVPPFFPWSGKWNHAMETFLHTSFGSHFNSFEKFGAIAPGISECSAGIGLAIVAIAVVSFFSARRYGFSDHWLLKTDLQMVALRFLPWALLLIFMAEVGEAENIRHLSPYYMFFFPSLLVIRGQTVLVRRRWWQLMALFGMVTAIGLLVVNPYRPLFPALTITSKMADAFPQSHVFATLETGYAAPHSLDEINKKIKQQLSADPVIGYATDGNGQLEPSLWMPFKSRQVRRVLKHDTRESLSKIGVQNIIIEGRPFPDCNNFSNWLAAYHGEITTNWTFQKKSSSSDLTHVYYVHLKEENN